MVEQFGGGGGVGQIVRGAGGQRQAHRRNSWLIPKASAWFRAVRAWRSAAARWPSAAAVNASANAMSAWSWGASLARRSSSPARCSWASAALAASASADKAYNAGRQYAGHRPVRYELPLPSQVGDRRHL